jgi:hypothetical protein
MSKDFLTGLGALIGLSLMFQGRDLVHIIGAISFLFCLDIRYKHL